MSLTYSTYVTSMANLMPQDSTTNANFTTMLPNMIDDAELRLYRELDLLSTIARDQTAALSPLTRTFTLPQSSGRFVVVDGINVFTPAGLTTTRNPLTPISREAMDALWPSSTGASVPQYCSMVTDQLIYVGPWPDAAYTVEVVGTIRPQALSTSNVTTILSTYFPDLFIAASMVFAAGYMKNFGAMVDDPKMGVTWEGHLQTLLASAHIEEMRKKFTSQGWSPKEPAPIATPPRT